MMRNSIAVLGCGGDKEEEAMKRIYHLRSQLMPYIYSSVHQCYEDMIPLNRGLYLEYPSDEKAYQCPGEFLFGDLLLGAPVTMPGRRRTEAGLARGMVAGWGKLVPFLHGESISRGPDSDGRKSVG